MSFSKFSSKNWRAERFTAMQIGGKPERCHATFCAHARRSTHRPIGTIKPVSSASGMNSTGGTTPKIGLSQRSSASAPAILPVRRSSFTW